jgi:hypothetical protein
MAPDRASSVELRRQIRRVRWRQNAFAAQLGLYGTTAVLAMACLLIVVLALATAPRPFAAALAATALGLVASVVLVLRATARAWVGRRRAAAWIDAAAGLRGRLTTALAFAGRDAFLLPLLAEQNERLRARWTPERLVPSPFPPLALGAALLAVVLLAVALEVAPTFAPDRHAVATAGRGRGIASLRDLGRLVARAIAAAGEPAAGGEPRAGGDGVQSRSGARDVESLANVPAALQAGIRRRLWGERLAGIEPARTGDRSGAAGHVEPRPPYARAAHAPAGRADGAAAVPPSGGTDRASAGAGQGEAAPGAGTGSDPALFGAESDVEAAEGHFTLALAARVHGRPAGADRPSGRAPARDADRRPHLAARPRPDEPFHAVVVPPGFAPVVRALFAHERAPEGGP